jgi:hypothetical protein
MKRITLLLTLLLCSVQFLLSQKVDSINVEQTGDFIKIRYKILNSNPDQLFRVRVLCAINGGLNTEIKSVSGDTGDNVVGGKNDYFVVWDVLKDVSELTSAEFIVRAELIKDLNAINIQGNKDVVLTEKWSKKWFNIMLAAEAPSEPKVGFRVGIMGSFGISAQFVRGKIAVTDPGGNPAFSSYNPPKENAMSLDITKRIVNQNGFQMHLMAGIQKTRIAFIAAGATVNPIQPQKVYGPEIGLAFGAKRIAFSFLVTHFDPGQVEKKGDWGAVSPLNYFTSSIGVRF